MSKRPRNEEIANGLSHAVGAGLGVAGLVLLVVFASRHGTARHVVSCTVYGTCIVLLFLFSSLYHFLTEDRAKKLFRVFDHASIFLLIAGTYTPFTLGTLRGGWGWSLFGIVWGLAVVGVVLECTVATRFRTVSVPLYLLMGWLVVIAIVPLYRQLPTAGMVWLVSGGLSYTVGVVFYAMKRLPYAHTIWHVFVLVGSACHWIAVMRFVIPQGAGAHS